MWNHPTDRSRGGCCRGLEAEWNFGPGFATYLLKALYKAEILDFLTGSSGFEILCLVHF
jgi:hypothetical protein